MLIMIKKDGLLMLDKEHTHDKAIGNLGDYITVKEVENGYEIKGDKVQLYDVLYELSCDYDIELI